MRLNVICWIRYCLSRGARYALGVALWGPWSAHAADVHIESGHPLHQAVFDLQVDREWPICFWDVWSDDPQNLIDTTDRFQRPDGTGPDTAIFGRPVATLEFSYDPSATPDTLGTATLTAQAMVTAYNQLDHVAKYEVRVAEGRVHLIPTRVRSGDAYVPYVSIADVVLDLPKRKLSEGQALQEITSRLGPVVGHPVRASLFPNEGDATTKIGGSGTVLEHIAASMGRGDPERWYTWTWVEYCEPTPRGKFSCELRFRANKKAVPAPSPTVLCYPDFNNDYILGVVHERTGALDGYTCRPDPVIVRNGLELYEYGLDFGWDGQSFADVEIRFNVEGKFEANSACAIRMTGDDGVLDVHADRMCLVGRRGVDVGTNSTAVIGAEADAVYFNSALGAAMVAPNTAITTRFFAVVGQTAATVGAGSEIESENVVIRSLGDRADSKSEIGEGVRITGRDIRIEASRGVVMGPSVAIDATGEIAIRSTGGSEAGQIAVGEGATLTAQAIDTITLESSGPVTIGAGATLSADVELRIEAPDCTLDPTATLDAPTQSGSCLEVGPPPADLTCAGFPCQSSKVQLCHKPGQPAEKTLCVSSNAVPAHLGHGDACGPCPSGE